MYRALIEATAYGSRMIVETFRESGVAVNELFATGGISQKNAMAMQIYADVLNMPIHVTATKQGPALGSAIMGAVAAGVYENIAGAADKMHAPEKCVYMPDPERAKLYDAMYADYCELQAYFGQGGSDVMKRLLARRQQQK